MKHLLIAGAFVLTATAALAQYSFTSYPDYPTECAALPKDEHKTCQQPWMNEVRAVIAQNKQMCDAQPTWTQRHACHQEMREHTLEAQAEACADGFLNYDVCGN